MRMSDYLLRWHGCSTYRLSFHRWCLFYGVGYQYRRKLTGFALGISLMLWSTALSSASCVVPRRYSWINRATLLCPYNFRYWPTLGVRIGTCDTCHRSRLISFIYGPRVVHPFYLEVCSFGSFYWEIVYWPLSSVTLLFPNYATPPLLQVSYLWMLFSWLEYMCQSNQDIPYVRSP